MAWSTDVEDVKMLLDIPSTMNNALNDQLAFGLVDICTYHMLQVLCNPLSCFAKSQKLLTAQKIAKSRTCEVNAGGEIAHSLSQSVSNQFHVIILSLPM